MLRPIVFLATAAIISNAQGRPEPATIRIASPASGTVVHPGETITLEVAVTGPYTIVVISEGLGELVELGRSLKPPPYSFQVSVPVVVTLQPHTITAKLYDLSGRRIQSTVASDTITLAVEPSAPPRKLWIREDSPFRFQVGNGRELSVMGTFDGQRELNLNSSTLTTYETDPSGIVAVSYGQIRALAPGSTKLTARHQGLQASVNVIVTGDDLRITSPPARTVVHPGDELSVDVSVLRGPFESVLVLLAPSLSTGAEMNVQPYWFKLTIPLSADIGPTDLVALGRTASLPLPVFSTPVSIDIERADPPQSLFNAFGQFGASTWIGSQEHIQVYGKYPDNPRVDLSRSSLTTYETTSNGIVAIEKDGWIRGLAAGTTTVVVRHRNLRVAVKVLVRE